VARALETAHAAGIVHRDLKPSNILVDREGRVRVVDFGLAHLDDPADRMTRTGAVLGTPLYMAPEQVTGDLGRISPATDVYALGCILYEFLAGHAPYEAPTPSQVYQKILREDPRPPGRGGDVETVCLKALEKDPGRRYASAGLLADDLDRYLSGEPVKARPVTTLQRFWRRLVRNRRAILAAAAAVLLIVAAVGGLVYSAIDRSRRYRSAIEEARGHERDGRIAEARDTYLRALQVRKDDVEASAGFERTDRRRREEEERLRTDLDTRKRADRLLELGRTDLEDARSLLYRDSRPEDLRAEAEAALRRFDEAAELAPGLASAAYLRGMALRLLGRRGEARAAWERAVDLDPGFPAAHLRLATLDLEESYLNSLTSVGAPLRPIFDRVRALQESARRHLDLARERAGDVDEMERAIIDVLSGYARADVPGLQEKSREAIGRFGRRPGAEEFHWALSLAFDGRERVTILDEALQIRPKYPLGLISRAHGHLSAGDFARALQDRDRAIDLEPEIPQAYFSRGWIRSRAGRPREALEDYDHSIRAGWRESECRVNRGVILLQLEGAESAIREYDLAIAADAGNTIAYYNRGNARRLQRRIDLALEDYSLAIAADPKHAEAFNNRATIYMEQEKWEEARRDLARSIELEPKNPRAHRNLGAVTVILRGFRDALPHFDEAIRLDPAYVRALYDRGRTRLRLDDLPGARADLEAGLHHTKADDPLRPLLEAALQEVGRREKP
jgi:tetratricopeptide (TPR) repeat protein